ncbi:MAG: hypothetical protein H7A47_02655 [Verrucomicrobiales bacterium]|nr:hypothetical protein [Verrucomicrobiales bacterium]
MGSFPEDFDVLRADRLEDLAGGDGLFDEIKSGKREAGHHAALAQGKTDCPVDVVLFLDGVVPPLAERGSDYNNDVALLLLLQVQAVELGGRALPTGRVEPLGKLFDGQRRFPAQTCRQFQLLRGRAMAPFQVRSRPIQTLQFFPDDPLGLDRRALREQLPGMVLPNFPSIRSNNPCRKSSPPRRASR